MRYGLAGGLLVLCGGGAGIGWLGVNEGVEVLNFRSGTLDTVVGIGRSWFPVDCMGSVGGAGVPEGTKTGISLTLGSKPANLLASP